MLTKETFTTTNTTRNTVPSVPFAKIKKKVLGKNYSLSLVFVGEKKSQELNNSYRKKNEPTNCLSFSLGKDEGEIFLCLSKAKKEHKKFGQKFDSFVTFLFIHSLLHLKGMEHSSMMEVAETKLLSQFSV